jgi:hypothetical protein
MSKTPPKRGVRADVLGNPLTSTFDGQTIPETDWLVKYTFFGDADLPGTIDAATTE